MITGTRNHRSALYDLQDQIHKTTVEKKWWDPHGPTKAEALLLVHSELGEATQALREDENQPSEHIPEYSAIEEELADVVIRVLDLSRGFNWDVVGAIIAKMEFNKTRPDRHGGKKF